MLLLTREMPQRKPFSEVLMARTPLFETHRSLNAKIVDFAGWEMPLPLAVPMGITIKTSELPQKAHGNVQKFTLKS